MNRRFRVKLIRLPFLIPTWAVAQVIMPRVIFVRKNISLTGRLLAHELCHVMQWEENNWTFVFRYLWSVRNGYKNSKYEAEAHRAESNPFYLKWAEELLKEERHG